MNIYLSVHAIYVQEVVSKFNYKVLYSFVGIVSKFGGVYFEKRVYT